MHRTARFALRPNPRSLTGLVGLGLLFAAAPSAALTLSDAGTPSPVSAFDAKVLVSGLGQPTDIAVLPDGRAVVALRGGDVVTVLLDMDQVVEHINVNAGPAEQGLLGVIADPSFATNGYLYFYASSGTTVENRHQVLRYKLGADSKLSDRKVLIENNLQGPNNHNGGGLDIYNNALYVSVGDTGHNATPPTNRYGTCLNRANGKILRVSLETGEAIPDNPLANVAMVTGCDSFNGALGLRAPEKRIFAWGFRNPFRFWVDPKTGKMWIADVGEEAREEISIGDGGKHYGWPFAEGTVKYNLNYQPNSCAGVTPTSACVEPVFDYGHTMGRNSITGGRIIDGCMWPDPWKSRYIFGDHGSGEIWTLDVNAERTGLAANPQKAFATGSHSASFRMGPDNALYIVEVDEGRVQKITAKGAPTNTTACGGGGGGAGGSGAGGGASGGASGAAAGGSSGGTPATGGTSSTAGAAGGTVTAGSSSTAGSGVGGGSAGAAGSGGSDDSGCGCVVIGRSASSQLGLGAAVLSLLGLSVLRRKRSRKH